MGASLNGGTPISHPKHDDFLVGKNMVVGETHHVRKPPICHQQFQGTFCLWNHLREEHSYYQATNNAGLVSQVSTYDLLSWLVIIATVSFHNGSDHQTPPLSSSMIPHPPRCPRPPQWAGPWEAVVTPPRCLGGCEDIPPWEKENHLQNAIFGGYVSSLEDI